MFSRSTPKDSNDTHVGPATYVIYTPRDLKDEAVPFRFKIGHQLLIKSINNPSPSSYTIKYRRKRIKGAAWSKQTQERDCMVPAIFQGARRSAGSLDGLSTMDKLLDFRNSRKFSPSVPPRYNRRTHLAKPTRRKHDFPKKRVRSSLDSSARKPCNRCDAYKGSHWSKYREARFKCQALDDRPGPGAHNLCDREPTPQEQWFEYRRFCKRATAKLSRSTNAVGSVSTSNENLPGPSDTVFNDFILRKQSHNKNGTFSKAPRNSLLQESDTPSPANYDVSAKPVPVNKNQYAPFLSRAKTRDSVAVAPGPADYNPPQGTVAFNTCKKLPTMFANYVAPFGISAVRMSGDDDSDSLPGPASYDLTPHEPAPLYGAKKGVPCERGELFKARDEGISPLHYDMFRCYEKLKKSCDHAKKRPPFNSSGPRITTTRENSDSSPASYYINWGENIVGTMRMLPPEKEKDRLPKHETPGPADYSIHPLYRDAVVKAATTHNVSLNVKDAYRARPIYGPPLPKTILKVFVNKKRPKRFIYESTNPDFDRDAY